MVRYERGRLLGLTVAAIFVAALFQTPASSQEGSWEGLISAGRDALQKEAFAEAERHFEAALEQAEGFPSGDARLGRSYNNLAAVYYAEEDYERAEPLMRRALTELEETLGPENTEVAQTMKNLAALYFLQGDRQEAENLLKRSLQILETAHGPNHAFVATVLSNLAGLYQAEGRYQEAEPLLARSLAIWEGLLGPDHPDVVRSRSLLARMRGTDDEEAVPPSAVAANEDDDEPVLPVLDEDDEAGEAATALEQLTDASKAEALAEDQAVAAPQIGAADAQVDSADAAITVEEDGAADGASFAVHLSTLWSADEARRYWQALQSAVPEVLRDKRMEIEEVAAAEGASPFYRVLTTPFTSDPEAQTACRQIKSKIGTHDCNVVVIDSNAEG